MTDREQTLSVRDHARLLRERADRVDQIAEQLRIEDNVPAHVLTPLHAFASLQRDRAAYLEKGE